MKGKLSLMVALTALAMAAMFTAGPVAWTMTVATALGLSCAPYCSSGWSGSAGSSTIDGRAAACAPGVRGGRPPPTMLAPTPRLRAASLANSRRVNFMRISSLRMIPRATGEHLPRLVRG